MKLPKMIIFDYGGTLLYKPGFSTLRGEEALFKYIRRNKNNLTPREINEFSQKLFAELSAVRSAGFDIHERQFERLLYEYLELELTISYPEAERVFWEGCSPGAVMPGADRMLDYIQQLGIRSGVISNIGFSGAALTERLNRLLPDNSFEFVIASSEYAFRKPSRYLFELALKKAALPASEVWYCGDNIDADIMGASAVGIYPVWYQNTAIDNPHRVDHGDRVPPCAHLHIHEWGELVAVLEKLK